MGTQPSQVLATSLFWTDDRRWWPYVPVFFGVVAPAERRLRWWRWLLVGIAAHVIATYVGQGYLKRSINQARAPRRLVNARDVGVSYFVLGVAGALSGYVRRPWRSRCQTAALAAFAGNAALRPTFTEVGHLTAFAVGLAAVPLAPDRDQATYPRFPGGLTRYPLIRQPGQPVGCHKSGDDIVSATDKAKNKAQNLGGKAKEAVGNVTGDAETRDKGRGDQAKSNLKDAGEKVKDAFKK